jgi:acyl-CoA thioesterase I
VDSDTFLLKPGQTWILLGDSITQDPFGYATKCRELIRRYFPGYELRIVNAGVGGNKARDMVARLDSDVLLYHPNIVSISVGVNDVWHGFYDFENNCELEEFNPRYGETLEEYRADLKLMASRLAEAGATAIFVSPTMIGENRAGRENRLLESYIATMRQVSQAHNAIYCPMNETLWECLDDLRRKDRNTVFTTDGVHMNHFGAAAMSVAMLNALGFFPLAETGSK